MNENKEQDIKILSKLFGQFNKDNIIEYHRNKLDINNRDSLKSFLKVCLVLEYANDYKIKDDRHFTSVKNWKIEELLEYKTFLQVEFETDKILNESNILLIEIINEIIEKNKKSESENIKKYRNDIFKNKYTSDLFEYLLENYINENKNKYSQIYRFLLNGLVCSQDKYRDYINEVANVKFSKIVEENHNEQLTLTDRKKEFEETYNKLN